MNYSDFDKIEQDEWSLGNSCFEKQSTSKVIGFHWVEKGASERQKKYIVSCTNCAKDPELHGDGLYSMTKTNLLAGNVPCGCSKKPCWSALQYKVLAGRKLACHSLLLTGLCWNGTTKKSVVHWSCPRHGTSDETALCNVLNGPEKTHCKVCTSEKVSRGLSMTGEDIRRVLIEKGHDEGIVIGESKGNGRKKTLAYYCPRCDEKFTASRESLLNGNKPCRCSGNKTLSKKEMELAARAITEEKGLSFLNITFNGSTKRCKVTYLCDDCGEVTVGYHSLKRRLFNGCSCSVSHPNKRSEQELLSAIGDNLYGFDFIGRDDDNWKNVKLSCKKHGSFSRPISDVISGDYNCDLCGMFSETTSAYVHVVEDNGLPVAIKFGITKNPVLRISQQNKKNLLKMKNIAVWRFQDKHSCFSAEKECKVELECGTVSKHDLQDGHTETTHIKNLDRIIEIYENHGGKRINTNEER